MKRGIILTIHSIAGLISALFIFLMSLSGSALVFKQEIDRLQYPPEILRANTPIVAIDSCYDRVREQFPKALISDCRIPGSNRQPFVFTIYDSSYRPDDISLKVFVHPQSGRIVKVSPTSSFITNWLGRLHTSLFLGKTGEWLLGVFALVFMISLVTGLIQYRKNVLGVILFRKKQFRLSQLHQIVGVWALVFNLMIAITGFWMQRYVFKKSFYHSTTFHRSLRPSPSLSFSVRPALERLPEKYPYFTAHVIYFAQSNRGKMAIYGSQSTNSFIHSKDFADVIYLDSAGQVSFTAFVNDIDASSRYDIINSQVHFGNYGGWVVKIIYFFFGLAGSILSITGFLLWIKRRRENLVMTT